MGLHSKIGAIDWDEARRQGDVPGRAGAMREPEQLPLLDTTAPPVKRGLDPQDPDGEGWDERYYGAHSDGGD